MSSGATSWRAVGAGGMRRPGWPGPQTCRRWQRRFAAVPLMINHSLEVPARIIEEHNMRTHTNTPKYTHKQPPYYSAMAYPVS